MTRIIPSEGEWQELTERKRQAERQGKMSNWLSERWEFITGRVWDYWLLRNRRRSKNSNHLKVAKWTKKRRNKLEDEIGLCAQRKSRVNQKEQ